MRNEFDVIAAVCNAMGVPWEWNGFNFWLKADVSHFEELKLFGFRWSDKRGAFYRRFELMEG